MPFYGILTALHRAERPSCSTSEGRIAATVLGALPSKQTLVDLVSDTAAEATAAGGRP